MRLLPFMLLNIVTAIATSRLDYAKNDYYVMEHNKQGGASLHDCAEALGVQVVKQAGELNNHWVVSIQKPSLDKRDGPDRVLRAFDDLRSRGVEDLTKRSEVTSHALRVTNSIRMLERQTLRKRTKRDTSLLIRQEDSSASSSRALALRLGITDPIFPQQWHIVNDHNPEHMMNVTGLWEMGITGKGVISAMVDDGLDFESDDLAANFDPAGSYDFNDHAPLPKPMLWDDHHGTRCAGEIAAVKNDVCGVGLAYDSKVAGIRILSGPISDVDESAALNYGYQNTSIYSCSWGPPDDGRSMEGPSLLIQKAVLNGINKGRGGKGSIFVFASGNGASSGDQCNFDGYTNSIYSVTVGAVDFKGLHPYYSEACAANMVVTYSSGSGEHIHTTDVGKNVCAGVHGGTSAAAPLGVGVIALALSVRPDLTWRDVQHLCVRSARMINPEDPDWEDTFIGRKYSYKYGWGVLDAYSYVMAAQDWKLVKPQAWAETKTIELKDAAMNETSGAMTGGESIVVGGIESKMTITKTFMDDNNLEKLEHVTVRVWITHPKRGNVEVELISPTGVKSVLAARRKYDSADTGYPGWTFMTIKHWGENGLGDWTLRVSSVPDAEHPENTGNFLGWSMILWGETIDPTKAKLYELPDKLTPLPPQPQPDTTTSTETPEPTKVLGKPTDHLPEDHGIAPGEAEKPAFNMTNPQTNSTEPIMDGAADEGYFTHITDLLKSNTWLFAAGGIVVLFGICCGVFFWRRSVRRRRSVNYSPLAGDSTGMTALERGTASGGPRSKELYDAFGGEPSDDEDADEQAGLVRKTGPHSHGLGYHSGFLDDEENEKPYQDAPEAQPKTVGQSAHSRDTDSAGSEGTADGSWVHASR